MTITTKQNNRRLKNYKRLIALLVIGVVCAFAVIPGPLMAGCTPSEPTADSSETAEAEENSSSEGATNRQINWSMESNCATCHTYEGESMTDASFAQANAHENESCISCHTEELVLETVHEGVTLDDKPAKKATVQTVGEDTCISCHGNMAEMAVKTAGSTALADSNGVVVNPHEHQTGEKHEANLPTCTSCHSTHSQNLNRDSMKFCASCHHRGVFTCGNCHEVK